MLADKIAPHSMLNIINTLQIKVYWLTLCQRDQPHKLRSNGYKWVWTEPYCMSGERCELNTMGFIAQALLPS